MTSSNWESGTVNNAHYLIVLILCVCLTSEILKADTKFHVQQDFEKNFQLFKMSPQLVLITIVILSVAVVHCQHDLCINPKIDGITYVTNLKMYFIISGGYYWYNNTFNFPMGFKQNQAKKLPYGFTGQSVVYLNTIDACSDQNNVQLVAKGEKPPLKQQIVVSDVSYIRLIKHLITLN